MMYLSKTICLYFTLACLIASCTGMANFVAGEGELSTTEFDPPQSPVIPPASYDDVVVSACPLPLGAPALPQLAESSDWPTEVLGYLNSGGSLSGLIAALPSLVHDDLRGINGVIADIDGDHVEDFVISLADPVSGDVDTDPGTSSLLIYLCDQDNYRLAYAASSMPDADRIHLIQVSDLTGDDHLELLVMQEKCGAHTCFQTWEVLQWQGSTFANILAGRSDDLPSPLFEELKGLRADGSTIFSITGSGIGSAGAGPYRPVKRIWHWSPIDGQFLMVEEQLADPTFRIHAVHDADLLALSGDFRAALKGYARVVEDPYLDDYPSGDAGRAQLAAYALYRSLLLWLATGDLAEAETTFRFLGEAHPDGSPGDGYRALGAEVIEAYRAHPDLSRACMIARAYAIEHAADVLEPLNYGYANKIYSAADLCPYPQ